MRKMTCSAQRAAQRIADYDVQNGVRRETYCRHWRLTELCGVLHGACPKATTCADDEDAKFHLNRLHAEHRVVKAKL